jgi:hypothetical protein
MEHRVMPVWWRFGLVGFLGLGSVSDSIESFGLDDFKYSVGLGIRFQFDREARLNVRADYALGDGSSGFYLGVKEAF